jgi:hypothetical protein
MTMISVISLRRTTVVGEKNNNGAKHVIDIKNAPSGVGG